MNKPPSETQRELSLEEKHEALKKRVNGHEYIFRVITLALPEEIKTRIADLVFEIEMGSELKEDPYELEILRGYRNRYIEPPPNPSRLQHTP